MSEKMFEGEGLVGPARAAEVHLPFARHVHRRAVEGVRFFLGRYSWSDEGIVEEGADGPGLACVRLELEGGASLTLLDGYHGADADCFVAFVLVAADARIRTSFDTQFVPAPPDLDLRSTDASGPWEDARLVGRRVERLVVTHGLRIEFDDGTALRLESSLDFATDERSAEALLVRLDGPGSTSATVLSKRPGW